LSELVLTCEHAGNEVPPDVELGVDPVVLDSHVSWDEGALGLAQELAGRTGAPLFAGRWARLVVDLNRHIDPAAIVPELAFGVDVPGNRGLDPAARAARVARWHRPHRDAVEAAVRCRSACLHLSVHTFTPSLDPAGRDFDVGLLYDPGRPAEVAWAATLAGALAAAGLQCRHNAPYLGTGDGLTTWLRLQFDDERYAGIEVEVCQGRDIRDTVAGAIAGVLVS
jgi:predicted N-formylglutamate amidohydrolase